MTDDLIPLRVTYDAQADAAYIFFVPEITGGGVDKAVCVDLDEIGGMVNLDVDPDGRLLGVRCWTRADCYRSACSSGSAGPGAGPERTDYRALVRDEVQAADTEVGCAFCGEGIEYTETDPVALGIVERWRPYEERPDHTFYSHRACFASRLGPEARDSFDEPWDDQYMPLPSGLIRHYRTPVARLADIVFDCEHPASLARWWAGVLDGYRVAPYDEAELARLRARGIFDPEDDPSVMVEPENGEGPRLWFQRVPEHKEHKNRLHLDLRADNVESEVSRLIESGATELHRIATNVTMADPEGNEFCVDTA